MKKKIYIAGCGGMLGEAFYRVFNGEFELKCTDKDVNESWLSFLDFRDLDAYKKDVEAFKPDYLFHLGAYTDLEFCEQHVDDTYHTNTISAENAVYIANGLNIPLLYISTAGIFDGKKNCTTTGICPIHWVCTQGLNIWVKDMWRRMQSVFSSVAPAG